jgi:aryl-alcohol dehydrogenase-like predicted oxidoreductase/enamine deaminase RidA (YjgF/YER057c/UK114 family)
MTVPVERCELAPGFTISRVLTGLWQVADMERTGRTIDLDAAAAALGPYVAAGLTTFDMADHYGSAEDLAGLIRERHAAARGVELLTKWVPRPGPVTRDDVRAAVQRSLDRLRVDRIDLLQFHAWNYADPRWLDCLFWLHEFRHEGLISCLGLTNFDAAHLGIVVHSGIKVVSNQVCFSLIDRRPSARLTRLCLEHGVKLLAYGTVAGGFLTERWLGKPEPDWERLDTWSQMKYGRFIRAAGGWEVFQGVAQAVARVAGWRGVSMANVASRYILEQPAVGGVILGARPGLSEHVEDNLRVFRFNLEDRDRSEIEDAVAALESIPGDSGDEYRTPPFLTASGDLSHHFEAAPPPYQNQPGADGRTFVFSGTTWEAIGGFSRAVRCGDHVYVSGTTATNGDRVIGGSDVAAQLNFAIDKIEGALQSLGGRLDDVVRTRVFVRDLSDWKTAARVHGDRFRGILPANTLVQAGLVGSEYLVEIEAEAVLRDSPRRG